MIISSINDQYLTSDEMNRNNNDQAQFWQWAEEIVRNYEEERGRTANKVENSTLGYDIISTGNDEERHIEVKSKKNGKITWKELTPNETECLLKDEKYYVYLVEGDDKDEIIVTELSRDTILKVAKFKLVARFCPPASSRKK